jgi:hypothetical protein
MKAFTFTHPKSGQTQVTLVMTQEDKERLLHGFITGEMEHSLAAEAHAALEQAEDTTHYASLTPEAKVAIARHCEGMGAALARLNSLETPPLTDVERCGRDAIYMETLMLNEHLT